MDIDLFQYPRLDRRVENPERKGEPCRVLVSFSIHDWIEGSKTLNQCGETLRNFAFQYPRLDRRVENRQTTTLRMCTPTSFSIHDWIEGSKTRLEGARQKVKELFQYPRLDRRVENRRSDCPRVRDRSVSVSTTGSKGRKLHCLDDD